MTSVNVEQSQLSRWVLGLLLVSMSMLSTQLYAAPATIELFSGGGGTDTTAKLTASTDSHTYELNLNNPTDNTATSYTPTASVSYQVTSSVFNSVRYNSAANPATSPNVVFGGGVTTAADPLNSFVSPNPVYVPLNTIGSAPDTAFAATLQNGNTCPTTGNCASTSGGISAANNYGARLLIATRGLNAGGVSTSTGSTPGQLGTKVGTVVITFNRPVTNPIVHVAGLGGASTSGSTLGFSGQLQLTGSTHATGGGGAVLSRIAGSVELSVQGSNILNVATNPRAVTGSGGASGSILVTGRRINTLTFDLYIRGDGGLAQWSEQGGEAFFLGASSIEADNDLSIVKSQRLGSSGTFVQSQINGTQFDLIQYQLVLTNNSTIKAVSGAQLSDSIPASLTNVSLVSTNTTGSGTVCSPTLTGNSLASSFSGPIGATCTIIVQGYASTVGTVTNTASVLEDSTDPNTTNNSSVVNAIISAPAAISADPTINEARFTIVPDLPTIYRGGTGTQLVTITNNGPSNATGTVATFTPATQTGVSVTGVTVVGGSACTFSAGAWSCPVGNVANGANFQLSVTYSTTSGSSLGTAQQATIKVSSNEFNPGSGVGETLYKVWGSNQTNEIRPNGAFWVGYTGTGGSAQVGANTDETSALINAWPAAQASPTGAYLTQAAVGIPNSVYGASSTTASPMIQRVVTNMSTDPDRTVTLPQLSNTTQAGDNRRAWEYRTGIYVPTAQSVTLCVGNTSVGIDDGAYILVDGVVQGTQDAFVAGGFVSASLSLSAGYHSISYRIVNQNTYGGNAESAAGAYGAIGISLGATCNTANFDAWTNTAVPASINIIDGVDLQITKTNGVTTVNAGGSTSYTVVVTNAGPSAANGAFFRDVAATGLSKTSITCSAAGGAVCPTAPINIATVEGASGIAIPTFPSGGSVTFTVNANVTAVSGSVSNVATTTVPAGVTEINAANNSATDTDTVTPIADLSISKTDGVTSVNAGGSTTYTIVVSNAGPSAANGALFRDVAATGLNKTSVTCSASGGAVCPTAPISIATVEGASGIAIPTLPSSGSVTFTVVASVTATSGSVANTATIAAPAGTTDNNAANNSATDTDTVNPIADLSISKTDGVTSINAGSSTAYTIVVNNAGPSAADGALFRDVAATGLSKTSITCSASGGAVCPTAPISIATVEGASGIAVPTLPNGGSVTFTVVADVTAISGSVANTATITAPAGTTDNVAGNNSATDTNTVNPAADLSVVKSQRAGTTGAFQTTTLSVLTLGTVQYQLVFTNNGPSSVTSATLSDAVPAQFTGVSVVSATSSSGATACTASVTGNNVTGTWSGPSGAVCTVLIQATAGLTTGTYTNTASTTAPVGTAEINNANNSSSVQTAIAPAADLAIAKTQRIGTTGAFVSTPISVYNTQVVQYQLVLTNNGPTAATNATYTDTVPSNLTGLSVVGTPSTTGVGTVCATPTFTGQTLNGTFTAPQSGTCTVVIQGTASSTGSVTNTASLTAVGVTDTVAGNNSSSVDLTITAAADLTITKTNGVSSVTSGSSTAYTVVVTNTGPNAANNALFQDAAVAGLSKTSVTCTASGGAVCPTAPISVATVEGAGIAIPTLPSGGSVTFTVNANVTAVSGNVTNTATVSTPAGVTEINAANNTAADTDAVALVTDVSVTKTDGVTSVNAGGSTSYTIVVSNAGPSAANGSTFQDAAATGLSKTSVSCTAAGGAVCPTGVTISQVEAGVAIPTLPNGGSVTFTIGVSVTATSGSVANTATVTAPVGATDNNNANNSATDTNTVNPIADLSVTKTDGVTSVGAGGSTTYTIVVSNAGPSAANTAIFQDAAATGLSKTSVSCTAAGGAVCPVGVTISQVEAGVSIPTLPNGGSVTFTIGVNVTAVSGNVVNTATISAPAGTTDNVAGNNSATDTNTVNAAADLAITKTGTASAKAGDVLTYTLKVWNKGPSAVTDAVVNDVVPNNVSGVYIRCTATGSATCGSVTAFTSGSNTRGATGVSLPSDPTGNTHFVTYTITGLAYSTGSFTNTATVSSATATDANPADNSSSQATTITVDAPITAGSPANQCSAGDTVNVLTPLAFTTYFDNHVTQVTNITVNNAFTSYGTGTNGGIVLNGRLNWSYGIPRITGSTLRVNVNGTTYAVLTSVGASANPSQATLTALNGASVIPTTIALGSFGSEATAIAFSLTLPTTVTNITSANVTFNNTSPTGSNSVAGDDVGVAIDSAFQCLLPPTLNVVQTNSNVSSGISDFYTYTTGIVGVKEVSMNRDYDQNSSQATMVQTVSATTYSVRNAVIGTTPSNHINDYDVRLVCTNANTSSTSVMPNDATATTRTLPFDTNRSITLKRGDAVTCTWTNDNSFPRYVVSGRVFNDNSGTTGVAANAYNAVQDSGENGLANSAIQLSDCAGGVLATDSTDATGDYDFVLSRRVRPNQNICITEQNLSGYSSVSGVSGYNRTTDTITVLNPNAASAAPASNITAQNFGDARLGLILTSDGQQTTTPGGTVSYPHVLRAESVLTPTLTTSTTQQPNNAADQLWTNVLYRDSNCNGVIDPSEVPVGSLGTLLPNQDICVVQRVNAPTNASNGAQHVASLSASYVATVQGGDVLSGNSDTRKDTTLVGTGGLDMSKQVRVVSSCPSGDSSNTGFATQNTAKNGQFLEYQILYKNRSTRNLSEVVIRDVVPTNTLFKSAQCQVTPSGSSCAVEAMPAVDSTGNLRWRTTGPVAPNAEGAVRFCVQAPPLQ